MDCTLLMPVALNPQYGIFKFNSPPSWLPDHYLTLHHYHAGGNPVIDLAEGLQLYDIECFGCFARIFWTGSPIGVGDDGEGRIGDECVERVGDECVGRVGIDV